MIDSIPEIYNNVEKINCNGKSDMYRDIYIDTYSALISLFKEDLNKYGIIEPIDVTTI